MQSIVQLSIKIKWENLLKDLLKIETNLKNNFVVNR